MEWPIWSQTTEEQKPMWNAELVAKLEAERIHIRPQRHLLPVIQPTRTDSREEIEKRIQLATEIATYRKKA